MLLKNCLIYDSEYEQPKLTDILVQNAKIKHIDKDIPRSALNGSVVIDLKESYVLPGLIDPHTHLGIIEEATGDIGIDNNETSNPVTPALRAIDGVNPQDIAFADAVRSGITTILTGPGSNNVVGGQSIILNTSGKIIDKMVVKNPAAIKVAFGENPISTYGQDKKIPVTRMGIAYLLRELLMQAQDYMAEKNRGSLKKRNPKLEAVIPLLEGKIHLRAHAHRADDIVTAVRIAQEFGIKNLVIEHGTEADLVSEYLKEKEVPVAFGPMLTPRIKMELKRRNYSTVCKLVETGIRVGLITDHPYNSIDQLRTIAILAAAEGLADKDALKCITANPAKILGIDKETGSLKPGFQADLAVFNGRPLEPKSKVTLTIIKGLIVYRRQDSSI